MIVSAIQPVPPVSLQTVIQKPVNHVPTTVLLATTKRTVFHVIKLTTIENYLPVLSDASHFLVIMITEHKPALPAQSYVQCVSTQLSV